MFYVLKKKKIYSAMFQKHKSNRKTQEISQWFQTKKDGIILH